MKYLAIFCVAAFVLVGCEQRAVGTTNPAVAVSTPAPTPNVAKQEPPPVSMGFTPAEFRKRFNEEAVKRKMEFRIISTQLEQVNDVSDQWMYQFDNRIGFMATVNRSDGMVRTMIYMASGDGTVQSGGRLMFGLMLLIRVIDPALSDDTANQLALDLLDTYKTKKLIERVKNGVTYGSIAPEGVGLFVSIDPKT